MPIIDAGIVLALVLAGRPGPGHVPQIRSAPRERTPDAVIREALAESADTSARPVEACVAELASAGRAVIPGLLDVLEGGAFGPRQEAIVLGALERFGRGDLSGRIERLLAPEARPETRRCGYRLLGALGTRQDLQLLCAALRRPDPEEDPDRDEATEFRSAVARILARDDLAYPLVRTLIHAASGPIRYYLIRALSDTRSASALEILSAELRSRAEENVWLLTECAKVSAAVELPVDGAIPASIRVHLRSDDAMEVRAAVECLGRVEDLDSVSDLVALLDHAHPDVRRAALESLRSITGASLLPDVERWRTWLRAESAWLAGSESRLADDLEGADPVRKTAAIRELAGHPLHRRRTVPLVTRACAHETDALLRIACSALRQLRAADAIPFLERCAESPSKAVADEARAAIEAIRGTRLRSAPPGG